MNPENTQGSSGDQNSGNVSVPVPPPVGVTVVPGGIPPPPGPPGFIPPPPMMDASKLVNNFETEKRRIEAAGGTYELKRGRIYIDKVIS